MRRLTLPKTPAFLIKPLRYLPLVTLLVLPPALHPSFDQAKADPSLREAHVEQTVKRMGDENVRSVDYDVLCDAQGTTTNRGLGNKVDICVSDMAYAEDEKFFDSIVAHELGHAKQNRYGVNGLNPNMFPEQKDYNLLKWAKEILVHGEELRETADQSLQNVRFRFVCRTFLYNYLKLSTQPTSSYPELNELVKSVLMEYLPLVTKLSQFNTPIKFEETKHPALRDTYLMDLHLPETCAKVTYAHDGLDLIESGWNSSRVNSSFILRGKSREGLTLNVFAKSFSLDEAELQARLSKEGVSACRSFRHLLITSSTDSYAEGTNTLIAAGDVLGAIPKARWKISDQEFSTVARRFLDAYSSLDFMVQGSSDNLTTRYVARDTLNWYANQKNQVDAIWAVK